MSRPTEAPVHLSNFRLDKVSIETPTADPGHSANDPLGQTGKTPFSLKLETSTLDLTLQAVDLSPPIPQLVRIRNSRPISRALSRRNRSRIVRRTHPFLLFLSWQLLCCPLAGVRRLKLFRAAHRPPRWPDPRYQSHIVDKYQVFAISRSSCAPHC